MSYTCAEEAKAVAEDLGFTCENANAFITFRNPLELQNLTLPVLELVVIAGAVFALVHAVRRWRNDRDPVNLVLWFGALAYLAVIEPPLYFPEWFGLMDDVGFIFSHNVFTVQFMYDRLPLYIVAIYPMLATLGYEIVRALGIFERRGPLVGSLAVGAVGQVFYEIFDMLGPQLQWWAWNPENTLVNQPSFESVPMTSMVLFASVSFAGLTYLALKLCAAGGGATSASGVAWRAVVAGAVTPLTMIVVNLPAGVFGGPDPNLDVQRAILGAQLVVIWAFGAWVVTDAVRASSAEVGDLADSSFVRFYPAAYVVTLTALWAVAVPELVGATDGITESGTPIGSWWYASLCIVAAAALCVLAFRGSRRSVAQPTREVEVARTRSSS